MGTSLTLDEPTKSNFESLGRGEKCKMGKQQTILRANRRGNVRSKNNRKKKQNKTINFSIMGTNAAGLKAKKDSLLSNIEIFNYPSCITIQESKLRNCSNFKLDNYQVFEKRREGAGGGLLTAIDHNLDPVLIQSDDEDCEILVVQCNLGKQKIRIINGYGPQEDDPLVKRMKFWETIEHEIVSAKNEKCMILIELDANAKLGSQIIRNDPNKISENGQLLRNLIERKSLELLNNSPLCEGTITRHRVTKNSEEKSVIDYIITCDKLRAFLEKTRLITMRSKPDYVEADLL